MVYKELPLDKSIFIVGINSFIGSNLAIFFTSKGYKVSGTYRNSVPPELHGLELYKFSLGNDFTLDWVKYCSWIIYCAHDTSMEINDQLKAFERIADITSRNNINQIFLSSISASGNTLSNYGKTKYLVEKYFIDKNAYVLRPGLVIGKGGLFLKMFTNILRLPLTPLINGGIARIEYIGINDLNLSIKFIFDNKPARKVFNLISKKEITLYSLAKSIRNNSNKHFIPIYIPLLFIEIFLYIINLFRIPFPITTENLKGFKVNTATTFESNLDELSIQTPTDFNAYLKANMI